MARIEMLRVENEKLKEALSRQGDNVAFLLNHAAIPEKWYDKFRKELEEDRELNVHNDEVKK